MKQYRYRLLLVGLLLLALLTACGEVAPKNKGEDTTRVRDVTDLGSAETEADMDLYKEAVREIQSYELMELLKLQQNQVDPSHFSKDIYGTGYIYFGCPACPDCSEFEPYLLDVLEDSNQIVYYYDTSTRTEDTQYQDDYILKSYHVDSVPMLVKTVNGEYRERYQFDPDATAEETTTQLQSFIHQNSEIFPVTERNFPVQFHDYLFVYTFLIMCLNACYVALKQKELVMRQSGSPLIWIVVNSTLLLALHIAIAGFGFGFAMQYEATPSTSLFAKIGTYTWLIPTPLLYLTVLVLAIKIKVKRYDLEDDA